MSQEIKPFKAVITVDNPDTSLVSEYVEVLKDLFSYLEAIDFNDFPLDIKKDVLTTLCAAGVVIRKIDSWKETNK